MQNRVTAAERQQMIAEAAYFRAEQRGFAGGDPVADWLEAEVDIDRRLREIAIRQLIERLEQGLATATKKLNAVKGKASGIASETRTELTRDLEKLRVLRDSLRVRVAELRDRGEQAGQKAFKQAEKAWDDLSDLMQRLKTRASH